MTDGQEIAVFMVCYALGSALGFGCFVLVDWLWHLPQERRDRKAWDDYAARSERERQAFLTERAEAVRRARERQEGMTNLP